MLKIALKASGIPRLRTLQFQPTCGTVVDTAATGRVQLKALIRFHASSNCLLVLFRTPIKSARKTDGVGCSSLTTARCVEQLNG